MIIRQPFICFTLSLLSTLVKKEEEEKVVGVGRSSDFTLVVSLNSYSFTICSLHSLSENNTISQHLPLWGVLLFCLHLEQSLP